MARLLAWLDWVLRRPALVIRLDDGETLEIYDNGRTRSRRWH